MITQVAAAVLLRPDERSPPTQYVTPLPARDCFSALKAAATGESVFSSLGFQEGILWRERGQLLELRFPRSSRRARGFAPVVHNWFRVSWRSSHGETILEVTEHLGLQKGWWLPGSIPMAGGVLGCLAAPTPRWATLAALTVAIHGATLVIDFLTSAGGDEGDRASMSAFIQRTVQARPVVEPMAPRRRDPRFY